MQHNGVNIQTRYFMLRKFLLAVILCSSALLTHAQTADEVYNKYLDFNLARLQAETDKAMDLGQQIIQDTARLTHNVRVNFYNSMAKLYEDDSQSIKAIELYEKVVAAKPHYYVAHRALGYLYLKDIVGKPADQIKIDTAYTSIVKKALPHLEKAQACDPDDDTLKLIKLLYHNLKDDKAITTLPARLPALKKKTARIY